MSPDRNPLHSIRTFTQLVKYLRDELDWPIETENFEDLTFDYAPEELGLDAETAVKIKEIKQLRPLTSVVRHTDGHLFRTARARVTFSRMSVALAVQMKGLGF